MNRSWWRRTCLWGLRKRRREGGEGWIPGWIIKPTHASCLRVFLTPSICPCLKRPTSIQVRWGRLEHIIYHHISYQVVPLWQKMNKQLESAFCHPEHGSELIRQMEVLVEAGLKWNALGLTLPHIKEEESMVAGIKMTKEEEEEEEVISSLYLVPSQHTTITWDLDVLQAPSTPPNPTNNQVALARDGILKVED